MEQSCPGQLERSSEQKRGTRVDSKNAGQENPILTFRRSVSKDYKKVGLRLEDYGTSQHLCL